MRPGERPHLPSTCSARGEAKAVRRRRGGRAEVLAAITVSGEAVPGCVVERLGKMRYRPRATSRFAAQWFAHAVAPVVVFRPRRSCAGSRPAPAYPAAAAPPRHDVPGSVTFSAVVHLGLGWGMLPDLDAGSEGTVDLDPAAPLRWCCTGSNGGGARARHRLGERRSDCGARCVMSARDHSDDTRRAVAIGRSERAMLATRPSASVASSRRCP